MNMHSRPIEAPPAAGPAVTPSMRTIIENVIEDLLLLLDELDGDENLESSNDREPDQEGEPSLGWTTTVNQTAKRNWTGYSFGFLCHDLEDEHDGREPETVEDDHDREPDHDMETPEYGYTFHGWDDPAVATRPGE